MTTFVVAIIAGIGFLVADMNCGKDATTVAVITGTYYVPESSTVTMDANGMSSVDTSPEQFHVTSKDIETDQVFDIQTTKDYFASVTNDQVVGIRWKVGRWTGWHFAHSFIE